LAKRMILMLMVAAALIAALGFTKFRQIQEAMAQAAAYQPPPEATTTIVARQERWPETISAIGTVAAVQGVLVSADLPGIVERINFQSGDSVNAGDILVQLDTKQEQAQLAAVESDRDLARLNFDRLKDLVEEGAISRADFDRAAAEQKQTEARVGEIQATIARKMIRAPFTGILGIRQVNLGQYLSPGNAVVPLQSFDPIYVNFTVPQADAVRVPVGRIVRVTSSDSSGMDFSGQVTAINSVVDEATRNIQIQATLANPEDKLRPGMFVQTEVVLGSSQPVVPVPASAISYAPYGDSIFVVTELKSESGGKYTGARQQFVKLGPSRGDQIAVTSGIKPGDEIVTSGVFKMRNGAAVLVNNKNQPGNNPAPKVEDN
jgi:membrane fusion protein, multidrug efflux system